MKRNTLNWKHTTKNHKAYGNYDGSKYETPFMVEEFEDETKKKERSDGMKKYFDVIGIHKATKKEIVIEPHMTESQAMMMCEQWGWTYDDGTDDGSYWMEIREEKREMENKQAILNALCDALRLTNNAGRGNALKEIRYMVDEDGSEYAVPIFETRAGEPDEYYPHGYYGVNITADSGTAMIKDVVNLFVNVVW